MREIVFIADANRNILFMSKEGKSLFDLNGKLDSQNFDFLNLFHKNNRKNIEKALKHAIKELLVETNIIATVNSLPDTSSVNLKFKLNYTSNKKPNTYIGMIEVPEVPELKQKKNFDLLYKFIQNLPLGIYRTSIQGEVVFVNQGFLNIFGFSSEEELRKAGIVELFVEKDLRKDLIYKCVELKEYSFEFQAFKKDKSSIWVKDTFIAVYNDNGEAVFLDGVIEDISQKKHNEQLLLESEMKLRESNISKDRFFSIISHDLRSPFNQIIGATELLINKVEEYDVQMIKKFLVLLNEEAVQSYRLLENLLQWSKNQRGLIQFEPKPLSVERLIDEVLGVLEQIADKKEIEIKTDFAPDMLIYADKEMISTILRNLISNAIKFTMQKGEIIISASEKMDYVKKQSYFEFCVSDNGVGIAESEIPKLFSLNENYNTKGTYNESGTGLGLLLCKEFIDQHNGRIWAENNLDVGSSFKFTIPY